jgi:hypothetical protein
MIRAGPRRGEASGVAGVPSSEHGPLPLAGVAVPPATWSPRIAHATVPPGRHRGRGGLEPPAQRRPPSRPLETTATARARPGPRASVVVHPPQVVPGKHFILMKQAARPRQPARAVSRRATRRVAAGNRCSTPRRRSCIALVCSGLGRCGSFGGWMRRRDHAPRAGSQRRPPARRDHAAHTAGARRRGRMSATGCVLYVSH